MRDYYKIKMNWRMCVLYFLPAFKFQGSLVCCHLCKMWPRTWHKFLRYDREGVGIQAGHNPRCFALSRPRPPDKSLWSWPEVPWYIQWISSLPLHSRHASPNGMKHPQEIWVQSFPAKNGGTLVISVITELLSLNHTKYVSIHVRAAQLKTGPQYWCVWEYYN